MSTAAAPAPADRRPMAPGPKGHPFLGMLPEFRGDRLGFIVRTARTYGGVARFIVRGRSVFLVSDPVGAKHVLQDNADNYGRKTRAVQALRETLGNGSRSRAFTSSGWRASPASCRRLPPTSSIGSRVSAAAARRSTSCRS
jgi:hypothetical protein